MSPRLVSAFEKVRHLSVRFNYRDLPLRRLLDRAFSNDEDHSSTAIHRIEREYDPALAAIAWSHFWARQNDLFQARRELETVKSFERVETLWGGLALMLLGEILIEMNESEEGLNLLRRAREILGEPP